MNDLEYHALHMSEHCPGDRQESSGDRRHDYSREYGRGGYRGRGSHHGKRPGERYYHPRAGYQGSRESPQDSYRESSRESNRDSPRDSYRDSHHSHRDSHRDTRDHSRYNEDRLDYRDEFRGPQSRGPDFRGQESRGHDNRGHDSRGFHRDHLDSNEHFRGHNESRESRNELRGHRNRQERNPREREHRDRDNSRERRDQYAHNGRDLERSHFYREGNGYKSDSRGPMNLQSREERVTEAAVDSNGGRNSTVNLLESIQLPSDTRQQSSPWIAILGIKDPKVASQMYSTYRAEAALNEKLSKLQAAAHKLESTLATYEIYAKRDALNVQQCSEKLEEFMYL